jgi:hypothetical protein
MNGVECQEMGLTIRQRNPREWTSHAVARTVVGPIGAANTAGE